MNKTAESKPAADVTPSVRMVRVRAEPIELCQLLKFAGLTDSGGEAKQVISEGKVLLNAIVETKKRKKIIAGDKVTFGGETLIVKID
jgi:ribosome-associated protein